jgi:hypothetical protein
MSSPFDAGFQVQPFAAVRGRQEHVVWSANTAMRMTLAVGAQSLIVEAWGL